MTVGTAAPIRAAALRPDRRDWRGWGFVLPFLVVFAVVLVAPVGYAVYLSLFTSRLVGGTRFAPVDNYARALTDPRFWDAVVRVVGFVAVQVPAMLLLALAAALLLDTARVRFAGLFRLGLFLPFAVPGVVAALMWGFLYGDRFGLVANLDQLLGTRVPSPLSGSLILLSIGNIVTWEFLGYNMLIFYAALRAVPAELYEAAELDGAGSVRIIRSVKLPAIRSSLVVALVFSVIGSFQLFNEPNILQTLAPNTISSSFTPNMYAFNLSFAGQQYDYSAAVAVLMGVITVGIAYLVQLAGRERGAR